VQLIIEKNFIANINFELPPPPINTALLERALTGPLTRNYCIVECVRVIAR